MGNYMIIRDVEATLANLLTPDDLWEELVPAGAPEIRFASFAEMMEEQPQPGPGANASPHRLSIFLYQIIENDFTKNDGFQQIDTNLLRHAPLSLDLYYLVTPFSPNKISERLILGKVMEIFHSNPILSGSVLQGDLAGTDEEIKLILNPISLESLTNIWSTFQDIGYHLSIGYMLTPVTIDSTREFEVSRVESKRLDPAQISADFES
jgi:hypothetical protein